MKRSGRTRRERAKIAKKQRQQRLHEKRVIRNRKKTTSLPLFLASVILLALGATLIVRPSGFVMAGGLGRSGGRQVTSFIDASGCQILGGLVILFALILALVAVKIIRDRKLLHDDAKQ